MRQGSLRRLGEGYVDFQRGSGEARNEVEIESYVRKGGECRVQGRGANGERRMKDFRRQPDKEEGKGVGGMNWRTQEVKKVEVCRKKQGVRLER